MSHILLANWKMSPNSLKEAQVLFNAVRHAVTKLRSVRVLLAPPALFLHSLGKSYSGSKVSLCAQDISSYEEVAHTGSLSAQQFASSGATHVMIGHSESNCAGGDVRIKTFLAIKHGLTPIVFVGEEHRDERGQYLYKVREQMLSAVQELTDTQLSEVIFCYEPVWAVGQAQAIDAYEVHAMTLYIRKVLIEEYGATTARKVRVLYGGSVNSQNIAEILAINDLDGVAIGRASVDIEQFTKLLKIANKV